MRMVLGQEARPHPGPKGQWGRSEADVCRGPPLWAAPPPRVGRPSVTGGQLPLSAGGTGPPRPLDREARRGGWAAQAAFPSLLTPPSSG